MIVRPRSVAQVEEGGLFLNNYICMKPVRSIQMYPTTHLVGPDAVARFYSIVVGSKGSDMTWVANIPEPSRGQGGDHL